MATQEQMLHSEGSIVHRCIRFLARAALASLVAGSSLYLASHQGKLVRDEGLLEYPLWRAAEELDIAVYETELLAWATLENGPAPSMQELKSLAASVAETYGDLHRFELWSEAESGYRVVYYRGRDQDGGEWTASARYVETMIDEFPAGSVELALRYVTLGAHEQVREGLHGMRRRLERAVRKPLPQLTAKVRVQGRPVEETAKDSLALAFIEALGGETGSLATEDGRVRVRGYTPRLAGFGQMETGRANVEVEVSTHGQGPWIKAGIPAL